MLTGLPKAHARHVVRVRRVRRLVFQRLQKSRMGRLRPCQQVAMVDSATMPVDYRAATACGSVAHLLAVLSRARSCPERWLRKVRVLKSQPWRGREGGNPNSSPTSRGPQAHFAFAVRETLNGALAAARRSHH